MTLLSFVGLHYGYFFFPLWILMLENGSQYFKGPQSSSKLAQQEELCPLMDKRSLLYNHPKPQVQIHFCQPYFTERLYFCRHGGKVCAEHSIRIPSEFLMSFGNKLLLMFFFGIPFYFENFMLRQNLVALCLKRAPSLLSSSPCS